MNIAPRLNLGPVVAMMAVIATGAIAATAASVNTNAPSTQRFEVNVLSTESRSVTTPVMTVTNCIAHPNGKMECTTTLPSRSNLNVTNASIAGQTYQLHCVLPGQPATAADACPVLRGGSYPARWEGEVLKMQLAKHGQPGKFIELPYKVLAR